MKVLLLFLLLAPSGLPAQTTSSSESTDREEEFTMDEWEREEALARRREERLRERALEEARGEPFGEREE